MEQFPPRSALPRTITIAKVPMLGDTWYERGGRYWRRRVLMVVCGAPILALLVFLFITALIQTRQSSVVGFWIFLGIEVAYSLVITILIVVSYARRWHDPDPPQRRPKRPRSILGRIVRPFVVLAQLVLGLAAGLCIGTYVLLFAAMLMPQTVWERQVRLRMAEQVRDLAPQPQPAQRLRGMAKRLAEGPTLLIRPDQTDGLTALLAGYAPGARRHRDRMVMGNGVLLYGPVKVPAQTAADAGVPAEPTVAYYAGNALESRHRRRLEVVKALGGEGLIRGLAARLPATRYSIRPWSDIGISLSVHAAQPVPAEQVTAALQPFAGHPLVAHEHDAVADAYLVFSEDEPEFFVTFWPSRLANSMIDPPPAALGPLRDRQPCRWELRAPHHAATADADTRLLLGNAALALAGATGGLVTDMFGFPIATARDVLPG